jgi:hypothetical protein
MKAADSIMPFRSVLTTRTDLFPHLQQSTMPPLTLAPKPDVPSTYEETNVHQVYNVRLPSLS